MSLSHNSTNNSYSLQYKSILSLTRLYWLQTLCLYILSLKRCPYMSYKPGSYRLQHVVRVELNRTLKC